MQRLGEALRQSFDASSGTLTLSNLPLGPPSAGLGEYAILSELAALAPSLRTLNVANAGLRTLPKDLSFLNRLESLDVSKNPFPDHTAVLDGLASLPQLRLLRIDLPREEHEDQLVLSLAKLENLNGTDLTALPADDELAKYEDELTRTLAATAAKSTPTPASAPTSAPAPQSHTQQSASALGDAIEQTLLDEQPFDKSDWQGALMLFTEVQMLKNEKPSSGEFDRILGGILDRLRIRVKGISDPFVQRGERLQAHREMFDYIFEDVIVYMHQTNPRLGSILRQAMQSYGEIFHNFVRVLNDMKMTYTKRVDVMRLEVQRSEREMNEILDAAESVERETMRFEMEKARIFEQAEGEKAKLREELSWLKAENEKLLNRLRQLDLQRQRDASPLGPPVTPRTAAQRANAAAAISASSTARSASSSAAAASAASINGGGAAAVSGSSSSTTNAALSAAVAATASSAAGTPQVQATRELSLKQLLDFIEEIYAAKSKFDVKCQEAHLPRETMAKHLYTFLNQKYGLKTLILDWAAAVVNAVKKFEARDNDVAVFAKILRNEIDEEFRFVQKQLKETVLELLRVYLKGKYPLKSDADVASLLRRRTSGLVNEEEWVEIVKYMYNHEDSIAIVAKVREAIRDQQRQREKAAAAESGRSAPRTPRSARGSSAAAAADIADNRIQYQVFVRILLDFQLRGHERFLQRFTDLFRQFDSDANGVLNHDEFRALVFALDPTKTDDQVEELLEKADEDNNQVLTFSECVKHLSAELVRLVGIGSDGPSSPPLAQPHAVTV